ncbi:hypothetical protein K438DRAFT_1772161 [Mycena galopus ATCC 62051]|nr:hypothetical protein K438DRAFT_1772161 [Mycena galopus ATCC 62051]
MNVEHVSHEMKLPNPQLEYLLPSHRKVPATPRFKPGFGFGSLPNAFAAGARCARLLIREPETQTQSPWAQGAIGPESPRIFGGWKKVVFSVLGINSECSKSSHNPTAFERSTSISQLVLLHWGQSTMIVIEGREVGTHEYRPGVGLGGGKDGRGGGEAAD